MDRFSKERKTKYTYTHTHSLSSHFIADFLKTFFSVKKKKKKKLKESIFFSSLEGKTELIIILKFRRVCYTCRYLFLFNF